MQNAQRYLRAFLKAVTMTLRGEKPPERHPALMAWTLQSVALVDALLSAADASGLNKAAREAARVHVDKRDISLETIFATIRFHAATEYPLLLRSETGYDYLAIQATNLNDRYRLEKALESGLPAPVKTAAETLRDHLDNLPPRPVS